MSERVSRRGYVKYAMAGIVVVAGAAAGAYYASRPTPPPTPPPTTVAPTTQIITKTEVKTEAPKTFKVHAVHYGYHNEGSWEPQIYDSLMEAVRKSKYNFKVTLSEGVTSEGADTVIELAAKENDIVYATTNVYDSSVRKIAPRFPEVKFILESDPIGKNPKTIVKKDEYPWNVIILGPGNMINNYIAGALAAKVVGPKAKLGFIQSLDVPSVTHPGVMARAGAQSVYPEMEMLRDIMGDFVNPVKCRDAIKFMAAKGVKCVFLQQDDNSGIFEANAQGIYAVGDYRDLYPVAPDTILTSTVWNWEPGLTAILNAIAEDRWDEIRDKEWYWEMTVANGGLALGHFGHMVTEEQKAFAKDLTNKAATGELDLPYLDTW